MEFYNRYIKPELGYTSEIAFVNTSVVSKRLFYVTFLNEKKHKSGNFLDNNNYLHNLYLSVRQYQKFSDASRLFLERSNNLITKVETVIRYYSYIKVLDDKQNPQLENQIMILQFGNSIKDKLKDFAYKTPFFDKTFKMIVGLVGTYPNYDKCYFTDKNMIITDNNLNLESELHFKTLNIKALERKEKLQQIYNNIIQ